MPRGEIYRRAEMGEWIKDIRKRSGMSVASFGASLVRFKDQKGKLEAVPYKRVAVSYWESGEHLPSYTETIACLAMLDYDLQTKDDSFNGIDRLSYVTECMEKYLGRRLYCKNFTDLLIIYAARGILIMKEVPDVYNELVHIILEDAGQTDAAMRREFSALRDTGTLYSRLLTLNTIKELEDEVRQNRSFYAIGYKVLGDRLQAMYDEHPLSDMDFLSAVRFYAPVYKDSVKKLSSYEVVVSRRLLIDLGLQLHFSREQINRVLSNAQYMHLSEDADNPESLIRDSPKCANT